MPRSYNISADAENWIQRFVDHLSHHEDLNSKTIKEYGSDLRHLADWLEATWNSHQDRDSVFHPLDVTTPTLVRYREHMQTVDALKPATINRRLHSVKRFFDWAVQQGEITLDIAKPLKLVPEEKTSPRQMTDKEEATLVAAVQKYGTLRDYTIILLLLHSGLRSMELCDLTISDVVIGRRSGHVIVRSGKRNKQREVPLNITARTALENYLAASDRECDFIFPSEKTRKRLGERALRHLVQKYMELADLEGFSAHDLRHRFGYVMSEKTPLHRLAQIMGHDSLDTTMMYVQATRADLQSEVEKIAWQ